MSDFSDSQLVVPERLTNWDGRIGLNVGAVYGGSPASTLVSMTANQAIYLPIFLPWKYPVKRVFWSNGATAGGNVDIGFYTPGGKRLASIGGVAMSGTSVIQFASLSQILSPGRYFFAFVQTIGNFTTGGNSTPLNGTMARVAGYYQQASAYPLPATATFATWTGNGMPIFGFTTSASGV